MMKSSSFVASGALLILSLAVGCNEILGTTHGKPEGAGGSGGASSSASSGSGGMPGSTGTGGSTSTSGTSATSSTSAVSSSASSSASSSGAGGACGGDPCDCDDDKVLAKTCGTGSDCDDHDPLVHPGQTAFFADPIVGSISDFDYDCDGVEKHEIVGVLDCTNGSSCDTATLRWKTKVPACGETGQIGTCVTPGLLQCAEKLNAVQIQRCH